LTLIEPYRYNPAADLGQSKNEVHARLGWKVALAAQGNISNVDIIPAFSLHLQAGTRGGGGAAPPSGGFPQRRKSIGIE
jgi:hypothetical protein